MQNRWASGPVLGEGAKETEPVRHEETEWELKRSKKVRRRRSAGGEGNSLCKSRPTQAKKGLVEGKRKGCGGGQSKTKKKE